MFLLAIYTSCYVGELLLSGKKIARSNWEPDQFASSQKVRTNSLEE